MPKTLIISDDHRDCYQEIANIGMGQAADLLARLLGVFVILPIPRVHIIERGELHMALHSTGREESLSAVCQGFTGGGISGEVLLIFNDACFSDMAELMKYGDDLTNVGESELLMDMGSVLIGACLKGIADQLDVSFSQSHPVVLGHHSGVNELLHSNGNDWQKTLAIEINYEIKDRNINCDLLLLLSEDSIEFLENKISQILE